MSEQKIVIELGAGLESVIHHMIREYHTNREESLGENIQKAFGISFSEIVNGVFTENCSCPWCTKIRTSKRSIKLTIE